MSDFDPKERTYIFHTDPGHGWLGVTRFELERLELTDEISKCSYQDRVNNVYLEEDCDAQIFLAKKDAMNEPYNLRERYLEVTPIRNMASYKPYMTAEG